MVLFERADAYFGRTAPGERVPPVEVAPLAEAAQEQIWKRENNSAVDTLV